MSTAEVLSYVLDGKVKQLVKTLPDISKGFVEGNYSINSYDKAAAKFGKRVAVEIVSCKNPKTSITLGRELQALVNGKYGVFNSTQRERLYRGQASVREYEEAFAKLGYQLNLTLEDICNDSA